MSGEPTAGDSCRLTSDESWQALFGLRVLHVKEEHDAQVLERRIDGLPTRDGNGIPNHRVSLNTTKKNHYNPCFWTAHWNDAYYQEALSPSSKPLKARSQRVHVLSVRSGGCFEQTIENVHYDKLAARAEITREAAEEFARRYHPEKYERFLHENVTAPYPLYIDFENVFTALEGSPAYTTLLRVIRRQEVTSAEEKAWLACFVVFQLLRSHAMMNSMVEFHEQVGRPKFEHLVTLKWLLSDEEAMSAAMNRLVHAYWTLYVAPEPAFPLCDTPVLVSPTSTMVPLSPTLLLEILPRVPASQRQCRLDDHVPSRKSDEFRRRTIGNTFREIIFGSRPLLEEWRVSREFQDRVGQMKNAKSYDRLVAARGDQELWLVNAYGNQNP